MSRAASLTSLIERFCDPQQDDSVHSNALDLLVSLVSLSSSEAEGASACAVMSTDEVDDGESDSISLQQLVVRMEDLLTSSDDKTRHRATLLLAELLHACSPGTNTIAPGVAHLFVVFFLHRLGDYPSLLPSLHGLTALVVRFGGCFGDKYSNDVEELLLSVHKTLHIPALAQSIRQRYYNYILVVFRTPAMRERVLALETSTQHEFASQVIAAGDGEKDPRCLLLFLEVLEALVNFGFPDAALTPVLQSLFDAATAYFPITFNPPADDPYGITHAKLVTRLLGVLQTRLLVPLSAPFALRHIGSGGPAGDDDDDDDDGDGNGNHGSGISRVPGFSQVQGCALLGRLFLAHGVDAVSRVLASGPVSASASVSAVLSRLAETLLAIVSESPDPVLTQSPKGGRGAIAV